jgi:cytochrome c-type biogenesis protein CcmF
MEIEYIGEQAWWGQLGHLSVVVAFVTACFGVIAAYFRVKTNDFDGKWKNTARLLYGAHTIAVLSIFSTLLLMLISHRFEYQYVWQHSKRDLNMNYILAALWEGQEGSTLLWLTWHAILGWFVIRKGGEWEGPVIGVVSLVQVFLSMMLLGLYFGNTHIGSSPFDLIRLREENFGLPWTSIPDYLQKIPMFADGRGLNPLLQNYWMTIHPPTLFCGFALCTFPFAYAIAGLWTGKMYTWQKPALTWTFVGIMVLGTGILMGGAWAYESLSFGGFWAWDPVENASLVPWMILVGAGHVMLIHKIKGRSLYTTFILTIAAFLLVVYSTFLTKSGILAESSVHAFTEEGLNQELAAFMCFFLWVSVCFLSRNLLMSGIYTVTCIFVWIVFVLGHPAAAMMILIGASLVVMIFSYVQHFPREEKEEELWSREFWMFIGALVLIVAAGQIAYFTSMPVINKFLKTDLLHSGVEHIQGWFNEDTRNELLNGTIAPRKPAFYNKWQAAFAILIVILMGVGQFFKYRKSKFSDVIRGVLWPLIASVILGFTFAYFFYFDTASRMLPLEKRNLFSILCFLVIGILFSIFSNIEYFRRIIKGGVRKAGASIAHVGFGLLMLGAVVSTSKKDTISMNTSSTDIRSLVSRGDNAENIYLRRGDTLPMGNYMVTYSGKEWEVRNGTDYVHFNIDFFSQNGIHAGEKQFRLQPFIQKNKFMGDAVEPDTKHFLYKDIYSYVKFVPNSSLIPPSEAKTQNDDFEAPRNNTIGIGDTIFADNALAILKNISRLDDSTIAADTNVIGVVATFELIDRNMQRRTVTPIYFANRNTGTTRQEEAIDEISGTKLVFWKVRPENGKIDVYSSVMLSKKPDFVVLEVSEFPAINVLWLGCLVMITGTFIALLERRRINKEKPAMNADEILEQLNEIRKDEEASKKA